MSPRDDAAEWLREPARIAGLLHRALSARSSLAVRLGGADYSSLLLGLDAANGYVYIDEPYPSPAANPATGTTLQIGGRLDGGRFEFSSSLVQPLALGNGVAWLLQMPQRLAWYERRAAFRLAIPPGLALPPAVFRSDRSAFRGQLVDLSRMGAGAVIAGAVETPVGSKLVCSLSLPAAQLHTDVEVRSLAGVLGRRRVGLRFKSLSAEQDQKVSAAISQLQRQAIRAATERMARSA